MSPKSDNRKAGQSSRRDALKQMLAFPLVGGHLAAQMSKDGWKSEERKALEAHLGGEPSTGAVPRRRVPAGKIGDRNISRIIFGGNLIGGWAHARDLLYADELVKAYHTMDKVMEMYAIGEEVGINTAMLDIRCMDRCEEYFRRGGKEMQFIGQCPRLRTETWEDYRDMLSMAIDAGAAGAYVQAVEGFLDPGDVDQVEKALELLRSNGMLAGIGSHNVSAIRRCVELGFEPDFWMKTFHHHNYWSAMPDRERRDNMYCEEPEDTMAYMKEVEQPWIAFKVLAAGSIHPRDGFAYAFNNGADFICVGMYDFQVEEDALILAEVVDGAGERERPWRG